MIIHQEVAVPCIVVRLTTSLVRLGKAPHCGTPRDVINPPQTRAARPLYQSAPSSVPILGLFEQLFIFQQ